MSAIGRLNQCLCVKVIGVLNQTKQSSKQEIKQVVKLLVWIHLGPMESVQPRYYATFLKSNLTM